jgi:hypothetical protein
VAELAGDIYVEEGGGASAVWLKVKAKTKYVLGTTISPCPLPLYCWRRATIPFDNTRQYT